MSTQITLRRDTASNWNSVNPILELAEIGYITDAAQFIIKIGDGTTDWLSLPEIYLLTSITPPGPSGSGTSLRVATLSTTPVENTVYITAEAGTYNNIKDLNNAALQVSNGELCIFVPTSNGKFFKETITNLYNYCHFFNLKNSYTAKATARGAVPNQVRTKGLVITYTLNGVQYTEQFIGNTYSTADADWIQFGLLTGAVLYARAQTLTDSEKNQALANLGIEGNIKLWRALESAGYRFMGVATHLTIPTTVPNTVPGYATARLFYITSDYGGYQYFADLNEDPIVINDGEIAILTTINNGESWLKNSIAISGTVVKWKPIQVHQV